MDNHPLLDSSQPPSPPPPSHEEQQQHLTIDIDIDIDSRNPNHSEVTSTTNRNQEHSENDEHEHEHELDDIDDDEEDDLLSSQSSSSTTSSSLLSETNERLHRWHNQLITTTTTIPSLHHRHHDLNEMDQMDEFHLQLQSVENNNNNNGLRRMEGGDDGDGGDGGDGDRGEMFRRQQEENFMPRVQLLFTPVASIVVSLVIIGVFVLVWIISGARTGIWINISAWVGIIIGAITAVTCSGVVYYLLRQRREMTQMLTENERVKGFTARALEILTTDYLTMFGARTETEVIDGEIEKIEQCLQWSVECPTEILDRNGLDIDELKREFWTRLAYLYSLKNDQENYHRCIALISLHELS